MKDTMKEGKKHRARLGLIAEEKILMQLRLHWIAMMPGLLLVVMTGGMAFLAYLMELPFHIVLLLIFLAFIFFVRTLLFWYYHMYHVTNRRIFCYGLIDGYKVRVEEVIFDLIKKVDVKRPSLLATLLNYGHVYIGVENQGDVMKIRWVGNPQKVFRCINEALNQMIVQNEGS